MLANYFSFNADIQQTDFPFVCDIMVIRWYLELYCLLS